MLKAVYVLVSNLDDYFYEQMLVSILSLKHRMEDVFVILLTEQETEKILKGLRKEVYSLVDEVLVYEIDNSYNMMAKSRILKTVMRNVIEGDFLYIDCDTVICEDLRKIKEISCTSAVLDNHHTVNECIYDFFNPIKRANKVGYSVGYKNMHFNTGIIWCKDDVKTRQFFSLWNKIWKEGYENGILQDQLSFNECNNRMQGIIQEIDGRWNCQLRYGLPFLAEAKIIHYFASNFSKNGERKYAYALTDLSYLQAIREEQIIPYKVEAIIQEPKKAFHLATVIDIYSADYHLINSNIGALFRAMYRKHKKLLKRIESFLSLVRKIVDVR